MSEHKRWTDITSRWYDGHTGDEAVLRATAHYLQVSADWIAVRDFLINMAMSKKQVLEWFAQQDFPDFKQAVDEGWGWPAELEEA